MERPRAGQAVDQRVDEAEVRLLVLLGVSDETGDQRARQAGARILLRLVRPDSEPGDEGDDGSDEAS